MRALSESRFDEMQDKDICLFFFVCLFIFYMRRKRSIVDDYGMIVKGLLNNKLFS